MVFEPIGLNRGPVVATWLRFGIAGWFTRVTETTTAARKLLFNRHAGTRLGHMSRTWLEEYIGDSSKHDSNY